MARKKIRVCIVKKKKGPYKLRYHYLDADGERRQVQKSAGTRNNSDAKEAQKAWEKELREGNPDCDDVTWAFFKKKYEDEHLTGLKATTDKRTQTVFRAVEKYISPGLLSDIDVAAISKFKAACKEAGAKDSTIKAHLKHLRAALNWAVELELLAKLPKIVMPKVAPASKGRPLSGEECEKLLMVVPGYFEKKSTKEGQLPKAADLKLVASWQHYVRGLPLCGLRLAESLLLTWDDPSKLQVIDDGDYMLLHIPASLDKGGKERLLPITPEFEQFLRETPEAGRTGYVFAPMPRRPKLSQRLKAGRVGAILSAIGKRAGIVVNVGASGQKRKTASCHDLRRTYLDNLSYQPEVTPTMLKDLARHGSLATTEKYYLQQNARKVSAQLRAAHKKRLSDGLSDSTPATGDSSSVDSSKSPAQV